MATIVSDIIVKSAAAAAVSKKREELAARIANVEREVNEQLSVLARQEQLVNAANVEIEEKERARAEYAKTVFTAERDLEELRDELRYKLLDEHYASQELAAKTKEWNEYESQVADAQRDVEACRFVDVNLKLAGLRVDRYNKELGLQNAQLDQAAKLKAAEEYEERIAKAELEMDGLLYNLRDKEFAVCLFELKAETKTKELDDQRCRVTEVQRELERLRAELRGIPLEPEELDSEVDNTNGVDEADDRTPLDKARAELKAARYELHLKDLDVYHAELNVVARKKEQDEYNIRVSNAQRDMERRRRELCRRELESDFLEIDDAGQEVLHRQHVQLVSSAMRMIDGLRKNLYCKMDRCNDAKGDVSITLQERRRCSERVVAAESKLDDLQRGLDEQSTQEPEARAIRGSKKRCAAEVNGGAPKKKAAL